jgi:hypothetical protein
MRLREWATPRQRVTVTAGESCDGARAYSSSYYGPFANNQTANNKSPNFATAKRGENAAPRAIKQIHAMQKQAA